MDYRTGTVGRVISIRFDHGEDFLEELRKVVLQEKVQSCWFQVIGGLTHAGVVVGPREPVMPPDPIWQEVDKVSEVLGSGSIHMDGDEPKIHLHAALGQHGDTLTACVRRNSRVYLVLEVILFELQGFAASRPWHDPSGFNRVTFLP